MAGDTVIMLQLVWQ